MKYSITIGFLLIPLLFSGLSFAFAEEYYYIPDHLLENPPLFCAMEFEDTELPDAQWELMIMAENAVLDWEEKLVEATNNSEGWDFRFVKFSIEEQQELFFDAECIVNIYFERQPTSEELLDYSGYADSYLYFSDIVIFYLEPSYEYTGKTFEIDGVLWEEAEIIGFQNTLAQDIPSTLRHEIGHSLGLDHPKFESSAFVEDKFGNGVQSPSIMIDPFEYNIPGEIQYQITDYDVQSVVNLYGEDGINEFNPYVYFLDFIIIGIILIILLYVVKRKFKKKESEFVPLDETDEGGKCIRCSRIISSFSESNICNTCLQNDDFGE